MKKFFNWVFYSKSGGLRWGWWILFLAITAIPFILYIIFLEIYCKVKGLDGYDDDDDYYCYEDRDN